MKRPSEKGTREELRNKIIGLGEKSIRKSYYPELQDRVAELERINKELRQEIASRKKAEKVKIRLEEQLRQSMKMEAIGTLAGGIAHDFNNILTAIIGYTDLARLNIDKCDQQNKCPVHNDMDRLLEAGHRARELIKQILTFSRQQDIERVPTNLGDVLKEALKLLRSSLPSTVEIREDVAVDHEPVMADPTQVHQIVVNLCTNSSHAMRQSGGILSVSLTQTQINNDDILVRSMHLSPGAYLVLEVSDTGEGMSRAVLERIFDPYFTTKKDGGGTGMGLAVVHGIVKEHKGHISAYSEPGKGTTFRVYFPQIVASVRRHVAIQQEEMPRGKESILLIDDEEVVLELEKVILEKLGYKVTECLNPYKALEIFENDQNSFDLVITDMTMPKMNGAELTRNILKINNTIPVIICTGFSELMNEEKARAIGASEYIMKPLVMREIAKTLRGVLDKG